MLYQASIVKHCIYVTAHFTTSARFTASWPVLMGRAPCRHMSVYGYVRLQAILTALAAVSARKICRLSCADALYLLSRAYHVFIVATSAVFPLYPLTSIAHLPPVLCRCPVHVHVCICSRAWQSCHWLKSLSLLRFLLQT